jgi:DNA-binding NtrC family response regulator
MEEAKTLKILICDDDPAYRKLVRAYLRSSGGDFIVTEAGRKGEIQDALDKGGIDLILLDIQMPEKSGLEWLAEIVEKQIAPVIMLTGFGSEEIAVQSIHKGAIDYIPKDHLTGDRIVGTIKAALETWKRKQMEAEIKKEKEFWVLIWMVILHYATRKPKR